MFSRFSISTVALRILLMGPFEVTINGAPMRPLRTTMGNYLLALLVLHRNRPQSRRELALLLWPRQEPAAALKNLRRSLTDLRDALGDQKDRILSPTRDILTLDLNDAYSDILEFDALVMERDASLLERALALYDRGLLLPDCPYRWVDPLRRVQERQIQDAREWLADEAAGRQDYEGAIVYLSAVLQTDPWRETALRSLMKAQAAQGEYERALQAYRDFRLKLRRRTNGTPEPATTATYLAIQAAGRQMEPEQAEYRSAQTLSTLPRSLPEPLVALRGRSEAICEIVTSLDGARMLTLTGCGGIGKTALAVQVAHDTLGNYPGGAWFIDLAPLDAPEQILPEIAATLGVREEAAHPLETLVIDRLRQEPLLLILDNCEHLCEGCSSLVRRFLQCCPHLHVLATSRQSLGVPCELVFQVPSLPVPPETCLSFLKWGGEIPAALLDAAAVQLFVDRAAQVRPRFVLAFKNAGSVARICRLLEGIPLALELAAAWVRSLPVEEIANRLDDCLGLLTRGDPDVMPRHQTLEATIDWSYNLLRTAEERRFLAVMSVFAGGATLEAAEAVGALVAPERGRIVHLLAELVDKSFVIYEEVNGIGRYRLLEPIRQFVRLKCVQDGSLPMLMERHLAYFLEVATTAEPHLRGAAPASYLDMLEREKENFRAALKWSGAHHRAEQGVRLATAISRFWIVRGYILEGQATLEQLLACGGPLSHELRLKALGVAGELARHRADYASAQQHYSDQLQLAERLENSKGVAVALGSLGNVASQLGQLPAARSYLERAMLVLRELEDLRGIVITLVNLAVVDCHEQNYPSACEHNEEAIALLEQSGANFELAITLNNLADVRYTLGEFAVAEGHLQRSMAISLMLENRRGLANSLAIGQCMAADRGRMERAAILAGAEAALREFVSIPASDETIAVCRKHLAIAEAALGADAFNRAFRSGREMALSLEKLGAYVLQAD